MTTLYLEDFTPGRSFELGSQTITREEIIAFAQQYDPQPIHLDEERARQSVYGGLIASGWQTIGIFMRLFVVGLLNETVSMGSPGIDEVRWLHPVRPGDTLRARVTVVETVPSKSRPDRGILRTTCEVLNQEDTVVLRLVGMNIIGRRGTQPEA